tara:strand:- start:362 stop:1129 length:768 start_codon:yes stop_codon:yes gene_type:complete
MLKNYFKLNDEQELAYSQVFAKQNEKKSPGVVFLSGLKSDMEGTKAIYLHKWALQKGISFLRFDYRGHGNSSGVYEDTSLTDWLEDTKKIIMDLTKGPQILVGSSLGGWLSLLFAEKYPEKVHGIVGIAAAPDFTEQYKEENLDENQKTEIDKTGKLSFNSEYFDESLTITKKLIDDGNKNLILKKDIKVNCPIRLFQGTEDAEVSSSIPLKILEKIQSSDVKLTLVKNVDHRFSSKKCLFLIEEALEKLISGNH